MHLCVGSGVVLRGFCGVQWGRGIIGQVLSSRVGGHKWSDIAEVLKRRADERPAGRARCLWQQQVSGFLLGLIAAAGSTAAVVS